MIGPVFFQVIVHPAAIATEPCSFSFSVKISVTIFANFNDIFALWLFSFIPHNQLYKACVLAGILILLSLKNQYNLSLSRTEHKKELRITLFFSQLIVYTG